MQTYFHVFIKECRLNAGFSKIKSARLLNVSERSLSDYESGKTAVDDALAVKMAQIYNCPAIIYCWTQDNACGRLWLSKLDDKCLSQNILCNFSSIETMQNEFLPKLIRIGQNNKIDEQERNIFIKIKEHGLKPLMKSTIALLFTRNKKSRPAKQVSSN